MIDPLLYSLPELMVFIGLILGITEAIVPGAQFIVIGGAVFFAGLVGLLFPPAGVPIVLATLTVAFAGLFYLAYQQADIYSGNSEKTSDSDSLSGEIGIVTDRITRTSGEVKLENGGFNPNYQARTHGGEIPEGEEVIVVDPGGGNVVHVESLSTPPEMTELERELQ